jgi:sugar transferase (PEP-CTERM/EpsH1 system associated)
MAQYVQWVDEIPIVMDLVDVDSDKWTQYGAATRFPFSVIYRREGARLREYERAICEKAACVLVSTQREAELLRQISDRAAVHVIPNGVDTDYFNRPVPGDSPAPAVVFTGDMSYFPNEDAVVSFARNVLPLIRQSVPGVGFIIVGRDPSRKVRELQSIQGVEVTGPVRDVRTYLARAQVSVAPFSIAAGIQNKILEAMSYGLPVVATSRAVQGLTREVAGLVETGNTADELAARVTFLLRDPVAARRIGREGRQRVAAEYSWQHALERLLQLLENPAGADTANAAAHLLSGSLDH